MYLECARQSDFFLKIIASAYKNITNRISFSIFKS